MLARTREINTTDLSHQQQFVKSALFRAIEYNACPIMCSFSYTFREET